MPTLPRTRAPGGRGRPPAWLKELGGYFTRRHRILPAGRFNAGQKICFHVSAVLGLLVAVSGALIYFPALFGPYHYGFAFYDRDFVERERIEVSEGETVTLFIVPAQALPRDVFLAYAERSIKSAIGGFPPGDPRIRAKLTEDLALGNVEHIIGIAAHPVYVTTNVTAVLNGKPFREAGPRTLAEAVRQHDPAIQSVTFTAKRVGAFDVLCVDSGMDGGGTCGWGHKWMVAKGAFVVRP